ncbi:MAG: HlyD family efflux transporter periplasmic adaptor subunit [Gammaproteobacteria bacterium]|nr:HlyD family efflux transporter periplasmic adaptor subunit [Gammaproteobacteria bacterium]
MASTKIADTSAQDTSLPKPSRLKIYIALGVVAVILVVGTAIAYPQLSKWAKSEKSVSASRLSFSTVRFGDLISDISVDGRVVPSASPTVYAQQQGVLTVNVELGQTITQGQALGTIVHPFLRSQLQREKTQLVLREAQLNRTTNAMKQRERTNKRNLDLAAVEETAARREADRAQQSYDKGAISDVEYRKAMDNLESAKLRLQHATDHEILDKESFGFEIESARLAHEQQELVVQEVQSQVDQLTLQSPLDGTVGNILVERQSWVAPGRAVLTVVDLSQLELEATVPQSYADDISPGTEAEIRIGTAVYEGVAASISQEVVNNNVSVRVQFTDAIPEGLRRNQRVTIRLLISSHDNVNIVAVGPFLQSGGYRTAYVVEDGLAVRREIEVGPQSINEVAIVSGVEPGEEVVISDISVFDGADTVYLRQ